MVSCAVGKNKIRREIKLRINAQQQQAQTKSTGSIFRQDSFKQRGVPGAQPEPEPAAVRCSDSFRLHSSRRKIFDKRFSPELSKLF